MKKNTKEQPSLTGKNNGFTARPIQTLLIESSPKMMVLLARTLSKNKRAFLVGSASDSRKALCYASCLRPDLVIADLHMPGLDGAEAARLLKQRPNPPIVFVATTDHTPEARARCMAAGADGFLVKRADLAIQLYTAVHHFFAGDLAENRERSDGRYYKWSEPSVSPNLELV